MLARVRTAGAAGRRRGPAGFEAVVKPVIGFQPLGFDVDGVAKLRCGVDLAGLNDLFKRTVFGEFPLHLNRGLGHAATGFERFGSETGPENDALVIGITGCDSVGERIAGEIVSRGGRGVATEEGDR